MLRLIKKVTAQNPWGICFMSIFSLNKVLCNFKGRIDCVTAEFGAQAEDEETIQNCFLTGKFYPILCASGRYNINLHDTSCINDKQKKTT